MTDTRTEHKRRQALSDHEAMADAQAGCIPCKLCGGKAVITDAGLGAGYYVRCENSGRFRAREGCMIEDRRLGGWAYNVMDWWNRLHAKTTAPAKRTFDCTMCDDTGFKDHAWLRMEPCDHQRPAREEVSGEEVERVARAIYDIGCTFGEKWEHAHPRTQMTFLEQARAAIAAMNPKPAEAASGGGKVAKLLRAIRHELGRANDVIALGRAEKGQGKITVATAIHRGIRWADEALAIPETEKAVEGKGLADLIETRLISVHPDDQDLVLEDDDWRTILTALAHPPAADVAGLREAVAALLKGGSMMIEPVPTPSFPSAYKLSIGFENVDDAFDAMEDLSLSLRAARAALPEGGA